VHKEYVGSNDRMPAPPRRTKLTFGTEPRPEQRGLNAFSGKRYPRSDWKELMHLQEKHQSSPWHAWKSAGVEVKDQKSSSWCWCFGTVGAIQNRYAQQGMGDTRLSAASVAGPVMNYDKDRGGWGQYAVEHIQEHGIATQSTWPELSVSRKLAGSQKVINDRFQHDICGFEMFDAHDLDAVVSALICPINPVPVTLGLLYWGHLVYANRATFTDNEITLWAVNSWGPTWNGNGTVKLVGKGKCSPDESIAINCVKPITKK
jgi:hypothetical protein